MPAEMSPDRRREEPHTKRPRAQSLNVSCVGARGKQKSAPRLSIPTENRGDHLRRKSIPLRPPQHPASPHPSSARLRVKLERLLAVFSSFPLFRVFLSFVLKEAEKIALRRENERGVLPSERLTILLERAVKEEELWVLGKSLA